MSSSVHVITTTQTTSHNPSLLFSPTTAPQRTLRADRAAVLIDKCKTINQLLQIHAALLRRGLEHHTILNFKLLRSYSSLGCLDYSRTLFYGTHDPDVFFWTAIIHGHTFHGLHQQALLLYAQMLTHGVEPNAFTFSSIIKGCSIEPGRALHSQALKLRFDSDVYVRTALLGLYAKAGDVVSARHLFDTMPDKSLVSLTAMITCYAKHGDVDGARRLFDGVEMGDVVCWNVMIDGYTQHGRPNESLDLFRQMLSAKVRPDEVTILSVLSACGQLGALELGRWLHSYINNNGIPVSVSVGTALVDMYCKCGSLEDAHSVFVRIINKDVVAWNTMIVGCSMHGLSQDALDLFSRMCTLGIHPTEITFIGILSACSHGGLVVEGRAFFHSMKDEYGIEPRIEHYGCMVDLLGRAGFLDEAYELVQNMKIKPDPVIWGTLLGACRLHGNITLGENIAEFVFSNGLANSGTHILLANMYAAADNWNGVAKIRKMMKDNGVQKEPGCSSIEVDNKVHEFFAGDVKHPKCKEIYLMLEEMNGWLKAHGYTPQTDAVLQDTGEGERKDPWCL